MEGENFMSEIFGEEILYEKKDHIATITLHRPEVRNAFNLKMIDQWYKALEQAESDNDVRVIIITGSGSAFCSGGDIKEILENAKKPSIERKNFLWQGVHKVALTLLQMEKPVIAAINGPAFGAGLDMALHCDIRLASENAKFSESYVNIGLIPGNGGTFLLPKIVGMAKAMEMFFTGNVIDAEEAKRIGLVNEVYPEEIFMEKTLEMAKKIADGPPIQIRMIKRQLLQSVEGNLKDHLDLASSNMAVAMDTEDRIEGFNAFFEKRKPIYKGK